MLGKIIENYRITEIIGKGGMGIVYKALDMELDRFAALKTIDPVLAYDKSFLRRFKKEAKFQAKAHHVNIVTIYSMLKTEFGLLLAMEYVEGETLAAKLHKGALHWDKAFPIFKQVLNAIGHAHQSNVVHRDIKPRNIIITSDGVVKVTDFGLAKGKMQHGQESTVTFAGAGTLYYMSPEQVKGMKEIDLQTDIYSLGITLFEMLTGKPPFDREETDFTIQRKIVDGLIPSPSKINNQIPKELSKIVLQAINKEPQKRFQSTDEMLAAIENFEKSQKSEPGPGIFNLINTRVLWKTLLAVCFLLLLLIPIVSSDVRLGIKSIWEKLTNNNKIQEAYLTVITVPTGALVYTNDDTLGPTPIVNFKFNPGTVRLFFEKNNYVSRDTSIVLENGKEDTLIISLVSINVDFSEEESKEIKQVRQTDKQDEKVEVDKSHISFDSDPQGASIFINEEETGHNTPYTKEDLMYGTYDVKIEKAGYKSYSKTIDLINKTGVKIEEQLIPLYDTLNILVSPKGTILVDSIEQAYDTDIRQFIPLETGIHTITVTHPSYGTYEEKIHIIGSNKTIEIPVDFHQIITVTVTSNLDNCDIYVDGEKYKNPTPTNIPLTIGMHKIEIRKNEYIMKEIMMGSKKFPLGNKVFEKNFKSDHINKNRLKFILKQKNE